MHLILIACAIRHTVKGSIVPADNLIICGIATDLVIANAEAHHIYAHICRRLVWILAIDALKDGIQNRENLNIPVVIYGNLIVGIHMERIYHINVVKVCRSSLVGNIHRMLKR